VGLPSALVPSPRYNFRTTVNDIDLEPFAAAWSRPGEPPLKASGRAHTAIAFGGPTPDRSHPFAENLSGEGEFEVLDGDFYELPVLSQVSSAVGAPRSTARVGQAAGMFHIDGQIVHFDKAAVSAPVLGLQGTGQIHFDTRLDFRVVAAPLADWKQKLQKTKIPLIGDIGAELAGG